MQAPVDVAPDDIGEGAAAVDPKIPSFLRHADPVPDYDGFVFGMSPRPGL